MESHDSDVGLLPGFEQDCLLSEGLTLSHALLDMLLLNKIIWPHTCLSASPHLLEYSGGETSRALPLTHFTHWMKTNPNQSQVIKHHNDDISFWIQLSVRPQIAFVTFIKETSVLCDSNPAFPFQRWIKSWIMGSNNCRTWHTETQSITSSHTHTHTHLFLKNWIN